ncbi:MAG: sulfatase-like hydrolase/transferase [Candidatus Eisenbacteria bacterium]|nr:sulfatase-like hydrolase/transferase [Candidatus Eisenbacteria bacterium]
MRKLAVAAMALLLLPAGCAENESAERPEAAATRVLLLGIDSANWNVLTPMIQEGELPAISRLVSEGSFGVLRSGEPIQSPQMWTSIATGVVPEKHGITRFVAEVPGTDREVPVTSNMRKVKAFWNILSENDISVGIVGWWPSWPAEKVNGFMLAQRAWPVNWSAHGIPFGAARDRSGRLLVEDFPGRSWPEGIYEEFVPFIMTEEDVTVSDLDMFFADSRFTDPRKQFHARWVFAKDKSFADAGLHFLKKYEPEVFALYLQGPDVVSHYYWGYQREMGFDVEPDDARMYGSVVRNYYKFVDETIADYLEAVGEDCAVVVVSDHGFETKEDLKVLWEQGEAIRTKEGGKDVPWDHGIDGTFIFEGPGFRSGVRAGEASVVDVTPTLLAYLGLPVASDMDGEPLTEVFEPSFLEEHAIEYVDTYETGERDYDEAPMESPMDEGLKEKLRALGYIE